MCILFIAFRVHPDYPLILCANRDEFHHRATAAAHYWPPEGKILAGQDLQAGGTWLGLNDRGQIAALTNIRSPANHSDNRLSRGDLPLAALQQGSHFQTWLQSHSDNYNPFNLIWGDREQLHCYNSLQRQLQPLTPGCHAISNGALDERWPKMAKGELALEALVNRPEEPDIEALLAMMKDDSIPDDKLLPDTGVGLEWERRLSSIYICHPEYGTRSTTLILQDNQGRSRYIELRFDGKGRQLGRQQFIRNAQNETFNLKSDRG
ncbi:NRDE family protein [Shewanella cyperi]|uniref:NRDE family protein n=1 Tax=Shewanella cyperi TaxID=2814292 RepID=UPI001A953A59|nr:NRDE family protein [Shewanella cyperi]QSX40844.1 NRDE family protein [Shewanella cyperi]